MRCATCGVRCRGGQGARGERCPERCLWRYILLIFNIPCSSSGAAATSSSTAWIRALFSAVPSVVIVSGCGGGRCVGVQLGATKVSH